MRVANCNRGLGLGVVGICFFALVAILGFKVPSQADSQEQREPLVTRTLLFRDIENGTIVVDDAKTTKAVAFLPDGQNSFVGTAVRLMTQERIKRGGRPNDPFVLTQWSDYRLSLEDPATGHRIELNAFGSTNAAAFGRFLKREATP